jgi:serine phosphatase RsbU (regulator of sigma subunit)
LATIYETQQKDAEIAEQKASLLQTRVVALLVAIVLLTVFFIVYSLLRRRAAKMKAAQERIEGELQIARDIQMSMVPNIFPEREGLDMYASMTPAKEVGGDLYGYVLQGDKLYFALGDVSGKGVPASLFMAQATRLFLTLAKQGMMPGEICTNMNDALSGEDNENGMFVTFWLGLLDLQTGHLDFCNAGHNPPVIGGGDNHGDFLEMQPNAPIGLFPGLEYEGEEIETIKGRALFIYTDGLNEAENPLQEHFGDERLLSILRNTHFDSAQQVIESLKAEIEKHRKYAEPNDDLTMMCLRVS